MTITKEQLDARIEREGGRKVQNGRYFVTKSGDVYSLYKKNRHSFKFRDKPLLLKKYLSNGYHRVAVADRKLKSVHRLVAEAFLPGFSDEVQINHIDGDRTNNNLSNLEISNYSHNQRHAVYHLGKMFWRKLSDEKFAELAKRFANGETMYSIAKKENISLGNLYTMFKKRLFTFDSNYSKKTSWYIAKGFSIAKTSKFRDYALNALSQIEATVLNTVKGKE